MKFLTLAAPAALLAILAGSPAMADQIDFSQFGPTGTSILSGASGVTTGGVSFTISDLGSVGFTEYCEDKARLCADSNTWAGEFFKNEIILFDNSAVSPVTINFARPVDSIVDLQAQANAGGAFTEILTAYNGATQVGQMTADWFNSISDPTYGEGSIPTLSVFGNGFGITSITIATTNDGLGFALGGIGGENNSGAPEPASWALMIGGFGVAGAALRRRRTRVAA